MGLSIHKIQKWINMLRGKSVYHVNQGVGKCYSKDAIKGYYNDLTEKVTLFGAEDDSIPKTVVDSGETVYFSIAVFQYGLGAYDVYLMNNDQISRNRMLNCADWAVENQQEDGSWITFPFENQEHPYSSMAQAEGASLLIRAHKETQKDIYLESARKAIRFMLISVQDGGTTKYEGEDVFFYEYTYEPLILNGWIFSIWGLYDYCKYTNDVEVQDVLEASLNSLKRKLPVFDIKYWSKYDEEKRICSPFYHKLHIAQLTVMHDLFGDEIYIEYAEKWESYQNSAWNVRRAFVKKALQKIFLE